MMFAQECQESSNPCVLRYADTRVLAGFLKISMKGRVDSVQGTSRAVLADQCFCVPWRFFDNIGSNGQSWLGYIGDGIGCATPPGVIFSPHFRRYSPDLTGTKVATNVQAVGTPGRHGL